MVSKASSVEGAAGVHEAGKGRVQIGVAPKIEGDMRKTVVDGDRHGRNNWVKRRGEG
jgi:hypothetical protein